MKDVDFCVLMESVSEPFIEIIEDRHDKSKTSDSVTFLRFRSKMQYLRATIYHLMFVCQKIAFWI